jgi:hypothetical protein
MWRTLCHGCDDAQQRKDLARWCLEKGLDTAEKQAAYRRTVMKQGLVKLGPEPRTRHPGDDDEEVTT